MINKLITGRNTFKQYLAQTENCLPECARRNSRGDRGREKTRGSALVVFTHVFFFFYSIITSTYLLRS